MFLHHLHLVSRSHVNPMTLNRHEMHVEIKAIHG